MKKLKFFLVASIIACTCVSISGQNNGNGQIQKVVSKGSTVAGVAKQQSNDSKQSKAAEAQTKREVGSGTALHNSIQTKLNNALNKQ